VGGNEPGNTHRRESTLGSVFQQIATWFVFGQQLDATVADD